MCKNTCKKCNKCTDICSCRPVISSSNCKEKISTDCVYYKFGNQSSMSGLIGFLGVPNNTSLTEILEKLDDRLRNLYKLTPNTCARQLLGLPITTDIVFVIGKLLDYICTVQDVKIKTSSTDNSSGYLTDKIEVGDCIVKSITQDLNGNQKLRISIDYNCLKSKIPTCIEVNCTDCVAPTYGAPVVVRQGNNSVVTVTVTSPTNAVIQFSSDDGVTFVNGNPNSYIFTFPSNGSLQKIRARVTGCTVYADTYVQLLSSTPTTTPTATPVTTPTTPVSTPVAAPSVNCIALSSVEFSNIILTPTVTPTVTPIPVTPVSVPSSTPVATPVSTPTATPVSTPVATPVSTPVLTPSYNKCNNALSYNSSTRTCSGNNTIFNVSVSGNNGEAVEFSTNSGVTYVPANVGTTNSYTYTATSTGNLVYFRARIVGCTAYIEGSLLSCSVTPVATPTSTPVTTPVATPVSTPVATPTTTPVATPVSTPVVTPTATPVSNLTERKSVYVGYPNLYTSNNDVYDRVLNKFSNAPNEIDSVYTSNGFNSGSNVYRTSSGTLFGTGYLAYFVGNTLKKVKVTNGVISEIESDVTVSPVINPSTTKILAPFKHYNSGNLRGTGYALYGDNGDFLSWMSKLEIAADGLTISDSAWNNSLGTSKYWKLNKELVSTTPLSTPYRIPEIYKGTVVEIQIVVYNTANPGAQNSFSYSLLIAK